MTVLGETLLPIGRFARLSGLTVKALRHYDEVGLLVPARVDEATGYRYYTLAQAQRAEAICRLRALHVPLDEIRSVLDAPDDVVRSRLAAHRARLEGQATELRRVLAELSLLIDGEETLVPQPDKVMIRFQLDVEQVPEQYLLTVTDRAHTDEMSTVIPGQIDEVSAYLRDAGIQPLGPPVCICPFADDDGMLDAETGWPVDRDAEGAGRVRPRMLPATRALVMKHTGPYAELSRSYRLMSEVMDEHGLRPTGDPREIYVTDPSRVGDPNDYETTIVWPIGPEGELDKERDRFHRRVDVE